MDSAFAQADLLVELITTSVAQVKKIYRDAKCNLPVLDSPDNVAAPMSPSFRTALRTLQGACSQLTTLLSPPAETIALLAWSHHTAACLNVVASTKVAEHLQDKPDGLHVSELASLTKVNENKLDRALRLLCSKHCFKEVSSNRFANNRLSVGLLSEVGDFVSFMTDEGYYGGSALADTLRDPELTSSFAANETAFGRAKKYNGTLWDWLQNVHPEGSKRFARCTAGYARSLLNYGTVLDAFPWEDQPEGTVICDFGGGSGHISMHIAKSFPQSRFSLVVQDLPLTIKHAKAYWNDNAPDLVNDGRVKFVPFDFLKEDAVPGCDIYYMKNILHDWVGPDSKAILTHVRNVMKPTARLIIQDIVIQHASQDPDDEKFTEKAPEPLLPNYGEGKISHYYCDICMMAMCNSKERTLNEFIILGKECDLELAHVWGLGQVASLEFKVATGK